MFSYAPSPYLSVFEFQSLLHIPLVYPVVCHSIWSPNGFLSANSIDPLWGVGMIDFAGSGVVHTTGGITALFATIILGPRRGRFHDEEGRRLDVPREIPGHSMALQVRDAQNKKNVVGCISCFAAYGCIGISVAPVLAYLFAYVKPDASLLFL